MVNRLVIVLFCCFSVVSNAQEEHVLNTNYSDPTAPVGDSSVTAPSVIKPVIDVWMRDTYVTQGPYGNYYMIGTTANKGKVVPAEIKYGDYNSGLFLWKSRDLKNWDSLGLIWSYRDDAAQWQKKGAAIIPNKSSDLVYRALWAPELHYIKSKKKWLIAVSLNGKQGSFILESISGKPEGPYRNIEGNKEKPIFNGIDLSIFEDIDGAVYLIAHNHFIARMKDDLSDIAEPYTKIKETPYNPEPYIEGVYVVRHDKKYHLMQTVWSVKQSDDTYSFLRKGNKNLNSYDVVVAESDNIYGPYGERYPAIMAGGHNNLFQDRDGKWWSTTFFNPRGIQGKKFDVTCRPALIPVKWVNGKIRPDQERTQEFYNTFIKK